MSRSCFQTYLDDLNSSFARCRSASLLLPTTSKNRGANDVLCKLRQWKWISNSVLIRPWVATPLASSNVQDCLPTEDELLFLQRKYALSSKFSLSSSTSLSCSMREQAMRYHIESKSLIVPLTDEGTEFILRVLFEHPIAQHHDCQGNNYPCTNKPPFSFEDHEEKLTIIHNWIVSSRILLVHNCDGHQVCSLSKETDSFPETRPILSKTSTSSNDSNNSKVCTTFTFVDLFAGIGGFRIGLEELGGRCVGSCEIDAYARDTYRRNFHKPGCDEFYVNDISRLDLPPDYADVICGGFPCQSFSTMASFPSNKVKANGEELYADASQDNKKLNSNSLRGRQGGLDTPNKGKLFFHLPRILRKSRPKLFIFENVKGLMKIDNGGHFRMVLTLLEDSGYHVAHGIIDTCWFLPQRRERIYFVGIRLDLLHSIGSEHQLRSLRRDIMEQEWKNKYQIYGNDIINSSTMDKFDRALLRSGCLPHLVRYTPHALFPSCLGDILESSETVTNHHPHCFLTPMQWQNVCKQTYHQFHPDGTGQLLTEDDECCQTLISSYRQSFLIHSQFIVPRESTHLPRVKERLVRKAMEIKKNLEIRDIDQDKSLVRECKDLPRFFTPRECCRLQGFPEDFSLPFTIGGKNQRYLITHFYRQIGNAASPPCVAAVAEGALSTFVLRKNNDQVEKSSSSCVVFDLILKASPKREKVLSAIDRKLRCS